MQKLDSLEDLRVRRTRKHLQQAMIEVAVEKGFAALTVRDITERAMVNRSTFYRHYLDKYDLLEQHINEMYEVLVEEGGILSRQRHEGLIELLTRMRQFPGFYRVVLSAQADAYVSPLFCQHMQQRFLAYFHQIFSEAPSNEANDVLPPDLKFTIIASAGCSALAWWLEQEQPAPSEQFAHWLQQLIYDVSASVQEPKK